MKLLRSVSFIAAFATLLAPSDLFGQTPPRRPAVDVRHVPNAERNVYQPGWAARHPRAVRRRVDALITTPPDPNWAPTVNLGPDATVEQIPSSCAHG
jgi:hypothetical protein